MVQGAEHDLSLLFVKNTQVLNGPLLYADSKYLIPSPQGVRELNEKSPLDLLTQIQTGCPLVGEYGSNRTLQPRV